MAHALRRAMQVIASDLREVASARALAFASTHKGAADRMADRIVRLV